MKKWNMLALILALVLLLGACAPKTPVEDSQTPEENPSAQTPEKPTPGEEPDEPDEPAPAEVYTFEACVLEANRSSLLVEPLTADGLAWVGDKTHVAADEKTELFAQDEGDAPLRVITIQDIAIGDTVQITFGGDVAESYPTQILAQRVVLIARAPQQALLTPVEGEWVQTADLTGERVTVEDSEDAFVLRALTDLTKVELARVYFDKDKQDYVRRDLLWMADTWEAGSELAVVEKTPVDGPNLAISWEDEYGERERRLILPLLAKTGDTLTRSVIVMAYQPPFAPMALSAKADAEGNGTIAFETTPFSGVNAYGFVPTRTEIICRVNHDLDGCGRKESVQLLRLWDEYEQYSFALRVVKNGVNYDLGVLCGKTDAAGKPAMQLPVYAPQLWLADLNEDNLIEIYFGGDMGSDDFAFSIWTVDASGRASVTIDGQPYIDAQIVSIEDKTMMLQTRAHVLGSYLAQSAYCYDADGGLSQLDAYWSIAESSMLSLKTALPVTMKDGAKALLPVGTKLRITATDLAGVALFETASGNTGSIELSRTDAGWQIAGENDSAYFEMLPYAG